MDNELAKKLFEKEVSKLQKIMSHDLKPQDIVVEENNIYAKLPKKKETETFLLKVSCDENFPLEPADYIFVNPETKQDDNKEYWPDDNNQAFKINENPRWVCLAGTKEYKKRHPEHKFNSKVNTLSQTTFHIFRQINGWYAKK